MNIEKELKKLVDKEYQKFEAGAVPNIDPKTVLGIRIPKLREFAKTVSEKDREEFLKSLPHKYHDENMLHSIFLNDIKDYETQVAELERFMPHVTN
ncbi:MAG: hypothetical protein MJ246_07175 [Clostridia bacterium]|nr:hypothetical protein [Clostridia bacterium]